MKPEVSARQTPIYDIPEDANKYKNEDIVEEEENEILMIDVPKM